MTVRHKNLTDPALHEPKGASTASSGAVYVANGTGSGTWSNELTELENINLKAANAQWTDYVVPLVGITVPAGLTAPTITKINDNGAGSMGVYAWGFSATVVNEIAFAIQMPHGYVAGTEIHPHVHWAASTTDTGDCVWGLEYCISNHEETAAATTILTGTEAAPGILKTQVITAIGPIAGTELRESSIINCRFFRDATNVADTFTGVGVAMSFDIHFKVEKLGTVTEYPA